MQGLEFKAETFLLTFASKIIDTEFVGIYVVHDPVLKADSELFALLLAASTAWICLLMKATPVYAASW